MRDVYFDPQERAVLEAAMSRIIPTDETPGAAEAGTIDFLERYLSGVDFLFAKPDGSGFEQLEGKRARAWHRRVSLLRERYRDGVQGLERVSRHRFGGDFVSLTPEQQDQVLEMVEAGEGSHEPELDQTALAPKGAAADPALQLTASELDLEFLPLLALHTRQGFYADPVYGGNRNHVGWKVIGFPGPASLAEVHDGSYSTLPYFADDLEHPGEER